MVRLCGPGRGGPRRNQPAQRAMTPLERRRSSSDRSRLLRVPRMGPRRPLSSAPLPARARSPWPRPLVLLSRAPCHPAGLVCELITSIRARRLSNDCHMSLFSGGGVRWLPDGADAGGTLPRPTSGKRTWGPRRRKRGRWKQVWGRTLGETGLAA